MLRHAKSIRLWALLLICFAWVPSLLAAEGELLLLKGRVKISVGGDSRLFEQANETTTLPQGAVLQTGEDSRARVMLYGKSDQVELYSNSLLKLDRLNQNDTRLDFPLGKVRFTFKPSSARRVNIRTVNATIGVKGTDFVVQSFAGATQVMGVEGLVSFSNAQGGAAVDIGQLKASQATGNQAPVAPVAVTPEQQADILAQDEAEAWDQLGLSLPEDVASFDLGDTGVGDALDSIDDIRESLNQVKDTLNVTDRELNISVSTENEPFE